MSFDVLQMHKILHVALDPDVVFDGCTPLIAMKLNELNDMNYDTSPKLSTPFKRMAGGNFLDHQELMMGVASILIVGKL